MPKAPFVVTTHLTEPEHTQGLLDPSPDGVRVPITEDMTREIIRVAAFLKTIENAQDLSIGHLGDVEWLAGDPLDDDSWSALPAGPDGPPEFDYDLMVDAEGAILINIHEDGALASHGYVTDVQALATHFDLPLDPPKPTIYLVMEGGVLQHMASDDPRNANAAVQGVTLIDYDVDEADRSDVVGVLQSDGKHVEEARVVELGGFSQLTVTIGDDDDEEASAVDAADDGPQPPAPRRRPGPR